MKGPILARSYSAFDDEFLDRRLRPRIISNVSIEIIDADDASNDHLAIQGTAIDIGGQGLSARVQQPLPEGRKVQFKLSLPDIGISCQGVGLVCRILSLPSGEHEIGIRILDMPVASRQMLSNWLAERLKHRDAVGERRLSRQIQSQRVEFFNRKGRRLVGFIDHAQSAPPGARFIIIPPAYGETKTNSLTTSYFLAANDYQVLRYDTTDHVGESDGDMLKCRLRTMTDDLLSAIDYLQTNYGADLVGVVSNSLSARIAIKAASEDTRISILVTVVGVVDLQATLKAVYHEDMIGSCIKGRRWDVTDVLGFHVEGTFLETAIQDNFHNLDSTLADLKRIKCPVVNFATENDLWVNPDDIRRASQACSAEFVLIPGGMHQLFENRSIVKSTLRAMVEKLLLKFSNPNLRKVGAQTPAFREIGFQSRIERERLRHLNVKRKHEEKDFWKNYLTDFDFVMRSQEFQRLFQLITQVVPIQGRKILDAGCGNGNFGAWLFEYLHPYIHGKKVDSHRTGPLTTYVGIDYVEDAICEAEQRFKHLRSTLRRPDASVRMSSTLLIGDLNAVLPFCPEYFDICVSNLVLSYLDDPLLAIRQMSRVLVPKGTLIASSLKPSPDLSTIYRDFSKSAKGRELELARKLLNNAGEIRHWETEGHFRFFSADELERYLHAAGFLNVRSWPILADQGIMVAAEKV